MCLVLVAASVVLVNLRGAGMRMLGCVPCLSYITAAFVFRCASYVVELNK